jgi:hypothetical protein
MTPGGRFLSVVVRHAITTSIRATVLRRIRKRCPGWQFEKPYPIPAGFVPSGTPSRRRGPYKCEDRA